MRSGRRNLLVPIRGVPRTNPSVISKSDAPLIRECCPGSASYDVPIECEIADLCCRPFDKGMPEISSKAFHPPPTSSKGRGVRRPLGDPTADLAGGLRHLDVSTGVPLKAHTVYSHDRNRCAVACRTGVLGATCRDVASWMVGRGIRSSLSLTSPSSSPPRCHFAFPRPGNPLSHPTQKNFPMIGTDYVGRH